MAKKIPFLFVLLLIGCHFSMAQNTLPITYEYDAAGNRTIRKVLVLNRTDAIDTTTSSPKQTKSGDDSPFYNDFQQNLNMKIFPNPTKGIVKIEIQNAKAEGHGAITVFDSRGRRLLSQSFDGIQCIMDFSSFATGYYIVEMRYEDSRATWKIIKE